MSRRRTQVSDNSGTNLVSLQLHTGHAPVGAADHKGQATNLAQTPPTATSKGCHSLPCHPTGKTPPVRLGSAPLRWKIRSRGSQSVSPGEETWKQTEEGAELKEKAEPSSAPRERQGPRSPSTSLTTTAHARDVPKSCAPETFPSGQQPESRLLRRQTNKVVIPSRRNGSKGIRRGKGQLRRAE